MSVDLCIVIVNWNTRDLLAGCLASLQADVQTFKPSNVETFVIDNASTDGSAALVRERFPWVTLIENTENIGFARANNQGLALAGGRYLLLLNSDTVVRPGALAALIGYMAAHPEVGFLGCQLLNGDLTPQGSYADFPTLLSALLGRDFRRHVRRCEDGRAVAVDAISGACMLVRRETWAQLGGMDEAYHLFAEEVDWCYRGRRAGWQVRCLTDVNVVHFLGQSRKQRSWFAYLNLHRSRLLFFRKHYGRGQARLLWLGYIVVAAAKAGVYTLTALLRRDGAAQAKRAQNWRLLRWLLREQDILT